MKTFRFAILFLGILGSLVAFADKEIEPIGNLNFAKTYLQPTPRYRDVNAENGFYAIVGLFNTEDDAYDFAHKTRDENLDIAVGILIPDSVSPHYRVMIAGNTNLDRAKEACTLAKNRNIYQNTTKFPAAGPHLWASPKLNIKSLPSC